ncbi:MAG: redoxin family protein, partial [Odoribacter sp.]
NYPSYRIHRLMDKEYIPTNEFYNQLKDAIPEEETLLEIPEYHDAIVNMVNMYARQNMTDNDVWTYTRNRLNYIAKNIVNPVISSFLVDKFVTQYVGDNGTDHLDEIAPIYNAKVTCPEKKAKFDELCSQWIKITPGQPSPSFKYPDINGQDISLSDLAGKYVYIDVWATWCGPCQEELPHLKELEHKYKDKNIHFVSLSCDKNKATWEKMVKDDKLGGIQLHCGGDKTFSKAYIIRGIPRFILLDREGKIIEANMSRPSDPVTDRVLGDLAGI